MRQIVGWLILILSFFILGYLLNQFLAKSSQFLSPIPNNDEIRVIMISPTP